MKAVLFGGADIHSYGFINEYLKAPAYIICCDGGGRHAANMGIKPDVLLGDFDSIPDDALEYCREKGAELIRVPSQKDFTDMEMGLRHALENNADEIYVFGGIGDRLDHTFGNIHVLLAALEHDVKAMLVSENSRVALTNSIITLNQRDGSYVSLIPMTDTVTGIKTTGFAYPLDYETLALGSTRGISNEFITDTGIVTVQNGILIVIQSSLGGK